MAARRTILAVLAVLGLLVAATLGTEGRAQASYVKNCTLQGVMLTEATRTKDGTWVFDAEITKAERGPSRCDSDCDDLKGRQRVELHLDESAKPPRKGQPVRLNYLKKHNRGQEPFHVYTLLPQDGRPSP